MDLRWRAMAFDILVPPFFITRRLPWIPRNAERYRINRLFSVRLGSGVECRLVRRNMILWTFLAYIAAHYVIESKRTSGPVSTERQETMGHAAGRSSGDHQSHQVYRTIFFFFFLFVTDASGAFGGVARNGAARRDGMIQGHFWVWTGEVGTVVVIDALTVLFLDKIIFHALQRKLPNSYEYWLNSENA